MIEIAFRVINRLEISSRTQDRNIKSGIIGAKSLLCKIWQVQRTLIIKEDPLKEALEVDEFMGRCYNKRYSLSVGCLE
ncbi:hypothetical protein [Candidatus Harpocratesius sp.]